MNDGRVELAVAGSPHELQRFLDELSQQSRLARLIDNTEESTIQNSEFDELNDFIIRY